jgi:serine/threonine protein kinase
MTQACQPRAAVDDQASDVDVLDGLPVSRRRPGSTLCAGCVAIARLGIGHRCETWLVWVPRMFAPAVVKLPRPHQTNHPRARRSLRREVAALAANLHPGLPRLYVDGTSADEPYIVVEFVDGTALDDEVADNGPLTDTEAALLGVQILAALRTVHDRGLVHVDLKPENVMLRNGKPVVIDFGSARQIGAEQPPGRVIGSAGYAAPELEAGAPIAAAMDLFGLGVTLYEALAGRPAYDPDLDAADRPQPAALPESPLGSFVSQLLTVNARDRPDADQAMQSLVEMVEAAGAPPWPVADRCW